MRLCSPDDVVQGDIEHTFRNRSWGGLLGAAGVMGFLTLIVAIGMESWLAALTPPGLLAAFCLLLGLMRLHACMRPENWVLQAGRAGLYINLRPFQKPGAEPSVLFIPADEIAAVCKTHEVRVLPPLNGPRELHDAHIDVFVHEEDLSWLREALRPYRRQPGPTPHTRCPVRVIDPPGVRIVWDWLHPGENEAVGLLGALYPSAPAREVRVVWKKLTEEEKEALVEEMWFAGEAKDAERLVRYHRQISKRAARAYLRERFGARE